MSWFLFMRHVIWTACVGGECHGPQSPALLSRPGNQRSKHEHRPPNISSGQRCCSAAGCCDSTSWRQQRQHLSAPPWSRRHCCSTSCWKWCQHRHGASALLPAPAGGSSDSIKVHRHAAADTAASTSCRKWCQHRHIAAGTAAAPAAGIGDTTVSCWHSLYAVFTPINYFILACC